MANKLMSLQAAISKINNGDTLGIGGNTLNRAPMAAIFELIRQKKSELKLVKTAGGMDIDALCLAGCVQSVDAGFVSMESQFSLCQNYRKAVQSGSVKANEHACYTVINALRASSYGIPYMPVKGLKGTQLIEENDYFSETTDPFSGEKICAVKAITPDWTIIHVQYADELGNAHIESPLYEDVLMCKASNHVIVTAEHIVSTERLYRDKKAQIPHFLVDAVVHAPRGAYPCACEDEYTICEKAIEQFKTLKSVTELDEYINSSGGVRSTTRDDGFVGYRSHNGLGNGAKFKNGGGRDA